MTLLKERGRSDDNDARAFSFKATRLRNALNFSGSSPIEAGNVIETHEQKGESSTYTRLGSTLTISGERDAPRWL